MSRYECEACGLAAMDLPDGVDPEFVFERGDDGVMRCQGCQAHRGWCPVTAPRPPAPPLTAEEAAVVERFEAGEAAPESHEVTERVAQAIWEAADGYMSGVPWERAKANPFKEAKVMRQAVAAITAFGGDR